MKQYTEAPKDPFFNMTWDDLRNLEKPRLRLESRMNFETLRAGDEVMINPDNHGFTRLKMYERAKLRKLEFVLMKEDGTVKCFSEDGNIYHYHYQNLIIK